MHTATDSSVWLNRAMNDTTDSSRTTPRAGS
ncbi:TetR/AcrR family transcriptional regulator, partial [Xanthomonas oryzae pv. oryzae]